MLDDQFGVRLIEERIRRKLTLYMLASMTRVNQAAQRDFESGREYPRADYLARLAALGFDVHYVLTGERLRIVSTQDEHELLTLFHCASLAAKSRAITSLIDAVPFATGTTIGVLYEQPIIAYGDIHAGRDVTTGKMTLQDDPSLTRSSRKRDRHAVRGAKRRGPR